MRAQIGAFFPTRDMPADHAAIRDWAQAAGHKVVWPRREVRPGVVIGMVEDPDGN